MVHIVLKVMFAFCPETKYVVEGILQALNDTLYRYV